MAIFTQNILMSGLCKPFSQQAFLMNNSHEISKQRQSWSKILNMRKWVLLVFWMFSVKTETHHTLLRHTQAVV